MMKLAVKIIGLGLLFLWLLGCSPKYHLKRAKHHLEKAERKGYIALYDTIKINDTIRTETVKLDTLFKNRYDTIKLTKDRLKLIYKYDTITNQVYLSGECEADTIIREIPVAVEKPVIIQQSFWDLLKWWQWLIVGLVVLIGIVILVKM